MLGDLKKLPDRNVMVVSPDAGGVVRARAFEADEHAAAIIDKRRTRRRIRGHEPHRRCAGYTCILLDDIVDSGGTLVNAADALLANGAKDVYAYISHGVLSGGAAARITRG